MRTTSLLSALLFLGVGCQSAGSDPLEVQPAGSNEVAIAPGVESPYDVELVGEGSGLPTYAHNGRFYVLGQVGSRYGIRVRNPTSVRVEAVISVDGLNVIDGETANTIKRGYVIAPHSEITVDGFRTSNSHVAAFRFSSVGDSYAGRKGVARNVGVIGVAIFSEHVEEQLVLPNDPRVSENRRRDLDDDDDMDSGEAEAPGRSVDRSDRIVSSSRAKQVRRPAPRPGNLGGAGEAEGAPAPSIRPPVEDMDMEVDPTCCGPAKNDRPGLGTEYGESRYSAVRFTRFVRAHPTKPTAYAELRYNNAAGLAALGINSGAPFDANEVTRRETAEPFPGQRFSQPPR